MNLVPSPDGRFLVISTSGWEKPALVVFDTKELQVVSRAPMEHTWLGLAWHPTARDSSPPARARTSIVRVRLGRGAADRRAAHCARGRPSDTRAATGSRMPASSPGWRSAPTARRLYATQLYGQKVRRDRSAGQRRVVATAELPRGALHVRALARRQDPVRLGLGRRRRSCCSTRRRSRREARFRSASIPTRWCSRATARACSSPAPTRTRCGSSTSRHERRTSRSRSRSTPRRRSGSTPNGLSLSPDGRTLLVANADNNTVDRRRRLEARLEPGRGLRPGRLVSDRRAVRSRRIPILRRSTARA